MTTAPNPRLPRDAGLTAAAALLLAAAVGAEPLRLGAEERFLQEEAAIYTETHGLPPGGVRTVDVNAEGIVFAGTTSGIYRVEGERWMLVPGTAGTPVAGAAPRGSGLVYVGRGALWEIAEGTPVRLTRLPIEVGSRESIPADVSACGDVLFATATELYVFRGERVERDASLDRLRPPPQEIRSVAAGPKGAIALAARNGLFEKTGTEWRRLYPGDGKRSWAPRDVRAAVYDGEGRLWFASAQGAGFRHSGGWTLWEGRDGLPYDDFTALAAGENETWFGTRAGAIKYAGGDWHYRQGRRWLAGDEVRDIALGPDGSVWLASPQGISRIRYRPMTLAEKARFYEEEIDRRHRRTPYGYVMSAVLEDPDDLSRWRNTDSDNDGLWTSMYGAGECFAYAALGDRLSKARADAAFRALKFLGDVTQGGPHSPPPGFVARSILPASGPDPNQGTLERDRRMRAERDRAWKIIQPRWPLSADGKWYWKCDTSSDELDGHYFFYARYYDLACETEAERDAVRAVVRRLTDHLIEHGYRLIDHDGRPTRWARFAPEDLNHDPQWWEERGLNSLSILSYLRAAEHITRDGRYGEAARELIEQHGYALNVMYPKNQRGPGSGNQSDDEMAFMCFYNLLRYERDPALRRVFGYAFHRYWELEKDERNPLFHFLYAASVEGIVWEDPFKKLPLAPYGDWLEDSLDTLRRFPLDRRNWAFRNSHRRDIVFLPRWTRPDVDRPRGRRTDGKALRVDERHFEHWNHDPWILDGGGDGRVLADGAAFLLPYYLGLYHGFLRR